MYTNTHNNLQDVAMVFAVNDFGMGIYWTVTCMYMYVNHHASMIASLYFQGQI